MTDEPTDTDSSLPFVSVVVIGRNEGSRLIACLNAIKAMQAVGGPIEVIYVDSASTDGSSEVAEAMGARVVQVRPDRPSAALARNGGWRIAQGQFVFFLDGDTIVHPDFLAKALDEFRDPQPAVVWGHRREIHPGASIYNRVLDLDWIYPPGLSEFCGGDAVMRRSVLEEVGGYDDALIAGEEPEMCRRIRAQGYTIVHIDHPMTGHDLAIKHLGQYWRRAFRAGYAYAEVSARFRNSQMPMWEAETRRNSIHALALMALPVLAIAAWVVSGSGLVPLIPAALLGLLVVRTALKVGWKSSNFGTRLLYGCHSHFQQIPIFFGQVRFLRDKRSGARQRLIEYKRPVA